MVSPCVILLSELDEVLGQLNQGPSTSRAPIVETTDTSGEETDTSEPRRRVRVSPHPWQLRGLTALPRDPAFREGSAAPT